MIFCIFFPFIFTEYKLTIYSVIILIEYPKIIAELITKIITNILDSEVPSNSSKPTKEIVMIAIYIASIQLCPEIYL